jgi:hypothetical protein
MKRRYFFKQLASGLAAAIAGPAIFTPKLIKPAWKPLVKPEHQVFTKSVYQVFFYDLPIKIDDGVIAESCDNLDGALGITYNITQERPGAPIKCDRACYMVSENPDEVVKQIDKMRTEVGQPMSYSIKPVKIQLAAKPKWEISV